MRWQLSWIWACRVRSRCPTASTTFRMGYFSRTVPHILRQLNSSALVIFIDGIFGSRSDRSEFSFPPPKHSLYHIQGTAAGTLCPRDCSPGCVMT
ncbi:hypothetical protein FRACA_370016 [Frankia canadensis]|uniref:Uncharacterized protein n=1 Tax=Frankia canadensis TaxID=1836972 RepID=A0A2I2KVP9_9ACTN|nr:hypothetical protein FRACA_370016 [Frankia canadensis]SOU57029.1 hypothetical protein FRACA_370016 [Frankia canadensis]